MLTSSPLPRRRGLTLVESLVAMFVAALAMISLLALFPLGALQMAQALKDARCTESATNAEALMRDHWRTNVIEVQAPQTPDAFSSLLGNPVFIDPIGANSGASGTVCGQAGLVRQNLSLPSSPTTRANLNFTQALRLCSLQDDMTYDPAGAPVRSGGTGPVERAGRYNWMAVLQAAGLGLSAVDLTILVFDGRAPGFADPNAELSFGISSPTAAGAVDPLVGATSLTLNTGGAAVKIMKGRWIGLWTTGGTRAARYLAFYRIVSIDDSNPGALTLELQSPVKPGHTRAVQQATDSPATTVVLTFAGLAEVFERPQLTSP